MYCAGARDGKNNACRAASNIGAISNDKLMRNMSKSRNDEEVMSVDGYWAR
jgi:hypothetical protein